MGPGIPIPALGGPGGPSTAGGPQQAQAPVQRGASSVAQAFISHVTNAAEVGERSGLVFVPNQTQALWGRYATPPVSLPGVGPFDS